MTKNDPNRLKNSFFCAFGETAKDSDMIIGEKAKSQPNSWTKSLKGNFEYLTIGAQIFTTPLESFKPSRNSLIFFCFETDLEIEISLEKGS